MVFDESLACGQSVAINLEGGMRNSLDPRDSDELATGSIVSKSQFQSPRIDAYDRTMFGGEDGRGVAL